MSARRLLELMQARAIAEPFNRFFRYFPDEDTPGFAARSRYPKHCEFFAEGKDTLCRLALAGLGVGKCITESTLVDTADGRRTVADLVRIGQPFKVWSWDGKRKVIADASVPFRKQGLHHCYRLTMTDGQWTECADHHRILTSDGWRRLSELLPAVTSPIALDGNKVAQCEYIGMQPVFDFTVEKTHCYIAGSLIHHNTEGMSGYEMTCHLTGLYPDWWEGVRYERPIDVWVAGDTKETTRDTQQAKLFGKPGHEGTGLIPKHMIVEDSIKRRPNSNGAIDTFAIKHVGGWINHGGFKAYDQGVDSFFGTEKDVISLDELVPFPIYSQCVARTRNRENARIMVTFTPMEGRTDTVRMFLEHEDVSRKVVYCGWDDAPHLTDDWKKATLANTAPYLRDTVSLGIPARGSGAVFPIDESRIVIDPFPIPPHFRRVFGFDGGKNTAFVFAAYDKENDVLYFIGEYAASNVDISVHAARVKLRLIGMNHISMPGVGDYSGGDTSTNTPILKLYRAQGLRIKDADKRNKDARVQELLTRMETDRFKVFRTCTGWLQEFRNYSYHPETGKIIKVDDHLIDAGLYACHDGIRIAEPPRNDAARHRTGEQTFGLYA